MGKRTQQSETKRHQRPSSDGAVRRRSSARGEGGIRETVESIAIAFALAFLFKTFQAEAYVIPTGSMAPTLYGRHKDVRCPACGIDFQVGASTEVDDESGYVIEGQRILSTLCPNCRRPVRAEHAAVFNGDRIIVNKQVSQYRRFDVVVFRNPEEGHVNYIKRLVGLPGETIRIRQGNLWMRRGEEDPWQMLRKDDPSVQKAIQLLVYDDNWPASELLAAGWPERWEPSIRAADAPDAVGGWLAAKNAWQPDRRTRRYEADASGGDWHWLRYRHLVPSPADWQDVDNGRLTNVPQASLVSDFCGFNVAAGARYDYFDSDAYWVGDLTLNCRLEVHEAQDSSAVRLELIEGPDTFFCTILPADGTVTMHRISHLTDRDGSHPRLLASGRVDPLTGTADLTFANVDNRLLLWIDDVPVDFGEDVVIEQNFADALTLRPGPQDTAPCGIAVRDAHVTVSDLVIQRDIYYRNDAYRFDPEEGYVSSSWELTGRSQEVASPATLHHRLRDPEGWADAWVAAARTAHERFGQYTEYRLDDDEYLMFGDNSPRSKDSRLFDYYNRSSWGLTGHRWAVKRKDLIGRALFVFWPHGIPFLNGGEGFPLTRHQELSLTADGKVRGVRVLNDYPRIRVPFYPNFSRMKKIR